MAIARQTNARKGTGNFIPVILAWNWENRTHIKPHNSASRHPGSVGNFVALIVAYEFKHQVMPPTTWELRFD